MTADVARILAGMDYREDLARKTDCDLDLPAFELHLTYLNVAEHAAKVAVVARGELADAVAQQERHRQKGACHGCWSCGEASPCPDAQQANRTLARLAMLYDVPSVSVSTRQAAGN